MRFVVLLLAAVPAFAAPVDVELVLGVDTSRSMDFDELTLQREGYARAFEHHLSFMLSALAFSNR